MTAIQANITALLGGFHQMKLANAQGATRSDADKDTRNGDQDFLNKVEAKAKELFGDSFKAKSFSAPLPRPDPQKQAQFADLAKNLGFDKVEDLGQAIMQAFKSGDKDFLAKVQSAAKDLFGSNFQTEAATYSAKNNPPPTPPMLFDEMA